MVKIGVTSWVWYYPFNVRAIAKAKDTGFDGIEIPIEQPRKIDRKKTAEELRSHGLECSSICTVLGTNRDVTSRSKAVRDNARRYIRRCVDFAVDFGTDIVGGPLYASVGKTRYRPSKKQDLRYSVRALKELGRYAEDCGVFLTVEPLNRYETRLVNLVSQCLELLEMVDSPAVKLHIDTYHANIEEKSIGDAIRAGGGLLYHVHSCENDRGAPGSGQIPWNEVANALRDIGYNRYMVIETFQPGTKEIATAASIWRPLARTQDELAVEGLRFLRKLMK